MKCFLLYTGSVNCGVLVTCKLAKHAPWSVSGVVSLLGNNCAVDDGCGIPTSLDDEATLAVRKIIDIGWVFGLKRLRIENVDVSKIANTQGSTLNESEHGSGFSSELMNSLFKRNALAIAVPV